MALARTWYIDANCAIPDVSSAANVAKATYWTIKSLLKGVTTGTNGTNGAPPVGSRWTVVGSSDAVTASATDNTDRWGDTYDVTKLVGAGSGTAHSWIVLKSPTGICTGGPYYICIDLMSVTAGTFHILAARTAFSGGSTTNRPTSTDEYGAGAGTATDSFPHSLGDTTSGGTTVHRVSRVTDAVGNFFILVARTFNPAGGATPGIFHTLFAAQKLVNLPGAHPQPFTVWYDNTSAGSRGVGGIVENQNNTVPSLWQIADSGGNRCGIQGRTVDGLIGIHGVATGLMAPSGRGTSANILQQTSTNPMTGFPDTWPAKYIVVDSASKWYLAGEFDDVLQTNRARAVGSGQPSGATAERVLVNNLLIPCDNVIPTL